MKKKVSETNKIKIFNLAVVVNKEWRRNVKKIKWKIATLKDVFIKQEVELLSIFYIWQKKIVKALKSTVKKIKIYSHRKIKRRQYLGGIKRCIKQRNC